MPEEWHKNLLRGESVRVKRQDIAWVNLSTASESEDSEDTMEKRADTESALA
jgi:hypothetical protein